MKIENTFIQGLKIIHLDIYNDSRGFFVERFNKKKFADYGLPTEYIQDNFSRSKPKVIRGLHYQNNPYKRKNLGCCS